MNDELSKKLNKHIENSKHFRISEKNIFVDDDGGEGLDILNLFLDLKENKTYYTENEHWQMTETTTSIKMKIIERIATLMGGKE